MARTEWREAGKELCYLLLVLVALALITVAGSSLDSGSQSFADRYLPLVQVALLGFALLSGIAPFAAEMRQGGMEYLLSLPYSRSQLLWSKFAPRLAVVLGLLIAFRIANAGFGDSHWPIVPGFFAFFLPAVFLISFSVSLCSERFVALAFIAMTAILLYLGLVSASYWFFWLNQYRMYFNVPHSAFQLFMRHNPLTGNEMAAPLPLLLLVIPFPLAFFLAFRRFDHHPRRRHVRRLLTGLLPGLLVALLLSGGWVHLQGRQDVHSSYYLTQDLQVLRCEFGSTPTLYGPQGKRQVPGGQGKLLEFIPQVESAGSIYGLGWVGDGDHSAETIERIDLAKATRQTLVHFEEPDRRLGLGFVKRGRELLWLEAQSPLPLAARRASARHHDGLPGNTMVIARLDLERGTISRIPVRGPDFSNVREPYCRILGWQRLGDKEWLILSTAEYDWSGQVLLVADDGSWWQPAGTTAKFAKANFCRHRLFLFGASGVFVYQLVESGWEQQGQLPGSFAHLFGPHSADMDGEENGEIFAAGDTGLVRLDLQNFQPIPILLPKSVKAHLYSVLSSANGSYLINEAVDQRNEVYRLAGDRAVLIRRFDGRAQDEAQITLINDAGKGILTHGPDGRVHAYAFPDLRELNYPEWN